MGQIAAHSTYMPLNDVYIIYIRDFPLQTSQVLFNPLYTYCLRLLCTGPFNRVGAVLGLGLTFCTVPFNRVGAVPGLGLMFLYCTVQQSWDSNWAKVARVYQAFIVQFSEIYIYIYIYYQTFYFSLIVCTCLSIFRVYTFLFFILVMLILIIIK